MDTKEKNRSPEKKSRSGQTARGENARRRPAQEQPRRETASRRETDAKRRSENTTRRKAGAPQQNNQTRRRQEEPRRREEPRRQTQARRPEGPAGNQESRPVQSNAEEVVFRPMEQQPQPRQRDPQAAKRAEQRRRSAQRAQERKKQEKRRKNRPSVVYTQPKAFNLNRLLLQMAVVLAVVLAITMGLSVFFKVENVVVYGNKAYSAWTVQEASGLEGGENLLTFGRIRASGKIKTALPYVDTVRIGIKLPDTVNIYIEEIDVAYAIQTADGTWWLMTSEGRVVEQIDGGTASGYTKVLGVELDSPAAGEQAKAVLGVVTGTDSTDATDSTEETVPVTVTGTDRLNAALEILECLEANDIVGEVASVDVSSLTNIELWYGQRYQVKLGDTSRMETKISYMQKAVNQLSDYEMGVLDISFTTWEDRPGFTPFE